MFLPWAGAVRTVNGVSGRILQGLLRDKKHVLVGSRYGRRPNTAPGPRPNANPDREPDPKKRARKTGQKRGLRQFFFFFFKYSENCGATFSPPDTNRELKKVLANSYRGWMLGWSYWGQCTSLNFFDGESHVLCILIGAPAGTSSQYCCIPDHDLE